MEQGPYTPKRSPSDHIQFRVLCPSAKTGAVIGRGGATVRHIQSLTASKIRLLDDPHNPPCEDRIVVISSSSSSKFHPRSDEPEDKDYNVKIRRADGESDGSNNNNNNNNDNDNNSNKEEGVEEERLSAAQKGLTRVFEKVVKGDSEEELGEGVVVVFKVVVGSNQVGTVLGRGGKVLEKIRGESGAQIRFLPKDQIPACASPGDELIQIAGSYSAVKKALLSVSSCLQDSSRGESMPAPVDTPQRGYPHGPHGPHQADYHSRGYAPNNRMFVEEDVVFKLLCPADKVGSLIGKGGSVVNAMQNETGASIQMTESLPDSDERIVVIAARENSEQRRSPAQDGVICVQSKLADIAFERGAAVVGRLLVHPHQIGFLLGKGGHIITEMRQLTGASIRIFPKDQGQAPKHGFQNDEIVQVVGSLHCVQDALFHITSRLREMIFPMKPPFSSPSGPPYPPPFGEMHPHQFRPRGNPASPGCPYPSPAGQFPSHPGDQQPSFSYGMDHGGPPNLDRGPYPYCGDRPGYGSQFESSPRTWTPQPFGTANPRGGGDGGPGSVGTHVPPGSGSQAPDFATKPVETVIPQKLLSHVYGENSSNLNHIRQISGANVLVHDPKPGAFEGLVVVSGTPDQIHAAQSLIHAFILCGESTC